MKIEYDLKDNLYKHQNLYFGIYVMKKEIKKNPHITIKNYSSIMLHYTFNVLLIFIMAIFLGIFANNKIIIVGFSFLMAFMILLLIGSHALLLINYLSSKKNSCMKGTLEFNKKGIIDQNEDITISFLWDKVDFIVIKNETIIVVPNHPTGLLANINKNDIEKIVKGIRKYNKEVLIIIA